MATMNVGMTLSLVDTASGPLRAFIGQMESLQTAANRLGPRLESIAAGITNIGTAAAGAAGVGALAGTLNTLGAAMTGVRTASTAAAQGIASISQRAGAAGVSTYALEQAMGALGGNLSRMVGQLATATAGLTGLAGAQTAANAAATAGAGHLGTAGTAAQATTGHVNTLAESLKGMAKLWGAVKIEQGLKGSISDASEFQQNVKGVEALNLGPAATAEIISKAFDDSKALKFVSALDAIQARMNVIAGLADSSDQKVIDSITRPVMSLANNLKFLGDTTETGKLTQNIMGLFEARGQTEDPAAMQRTMDLVQKASIVTHGKVDVRDWETLLRGMGAGAQNYSDEGFQRLVELMNQEKIAGGGGAGGGASRLSTQVKMLQSYAMGKAMNKQGAEMLIDADILTPGAIREDGSAVLSRNIKPGGFKNSQLAMTDLVKFFEENAGKILAYTQRHPDKFYPDGADPKDTEAIDAAVQKFLASLGFTQTALKMLSSIVNPRSQARIEKGVGMQQQAMGVDQFSDSIKGTYQQNVTNFDKALQNLKITIGTSILPAITQLMTGFGQFTTMLAQFAQSNPTVTHLLVLATAIIGVRMAISGISSVFGIVGSLSSALLTMSGAATTGMTAASAATATGAATIGSRMTRLASTVGGVMTAIGGFFMRAIPFVGWLLVAWDLSQLIGNLEVGGKKISAWASDYCGRVLATFKATWAEIKSIVAFVVPSSPGLDRSRLPENNLRQQRGAALRAEYAKANEFPDTAGGGRGTYAGYNAADDAANKAKLQPRPSAEEIRAKQLADAAKAAGGPPVTGGGGGGRGRAGRSDEMPLFAIRDPQEQTKSDFLRYEKNAYNVDYKADAEAERLADEKALADFRRNEAKASGDRHQAELLRIEQAINADSRRLVSKGLIKQEEVDTAILRAQSASSYAYQQEKIDALQDEERRKEDLITAAVENGLLSESKAAQEKFALRRALAQTLDTELAQQQAIANASGDDKLQKRAADAASKNSIDLARPNPDDVAMNRATRDGATEFFENILKGTMTVGKALDQFSKRISNTFLDLISKRLGDQLMESLFGSSAGKGGAGLLDLFTKGESGGVLTGGSSKGGGGWLGSIGSWLGGLFGGGGGGVVTTGTGLEGMSAVALEGFFDKGIDYVPHDMAAIVHRGERVLTASENQNYTPAQQGKSTNIVNHINVNTPQGGMSRQSANQLAADIAARIDMANRRFN